ncbi:MAG TPA: DNA repair protein RecO [Pyrinomonadaceae bacterium]|jgi:DNA repair protein RecO (recombination protein O)|nr:DNA repair protein RecO [Pyrinomonadaceae bacterium]
MPLVETEGLVLKSFNLAEADRIVVFLTRDHGVVRGVAKGAKRPKSRFGSGLEIFSIVRLTYFQKEILELVSIREAELQKSYFEAASNPEFLQKFSYLSDLLISFAPPHDPNETLYRMVRACLDTAKDNPAALAALGFYFELWLLRLGGYLPDWSRCDDCHRSFAENEPANLQIDFHLLCKNCARARSDVSVSGEHRGLYLSALRLAPERFTEITVGQEEALTEVSRILRRLISQIVGREITGERSLVMGS